MELSSKQRLRKAVAKMWQYINKNPRNKAVGDCAVRAISTATDNGWMETYLDLCLFGLLMADMPSANSVTTAYLRNKGFRRRTIPDDCPDCYTIENFCEDHPKGTFVIGTGSHLTTVIDGTLWDSWDSRNETPVYYFEKMED
jgi:hypothetical protein